MLTVEIILSKNIYHILLGFLLKERIGENSFLKE